MNRVLKVVFSRAKGMFVVVSELGRACTKGSLKSVLVAVPITLMSAMALGAGYQSTALGDGAAADDQFSTAVGYGSTTGWGGVAIGHTSSATAVDTVAVGHQANATGKEAVALGQGAEASGVGSVALGQLSNATENYTVSVGSGFAADADTYQYRRIVNVANGIDNQDAATVKQVKDAQAAAKAYTDTLANGQVTTNKNNIQMNSAAITTINTTLSGLDQRLANTQAAAEATAKTYTDQKASAAVATAKSYTDSHVNVLNNKIGANEQAIIANQNKIGANEQAIAANRNLIGANEQAIVANQNKIGANEQAIAANRNLIGANEQAIIANQNKIGANEQAIAANRNLIGINEQGIVNNRNLIGVNEQAIANNRNLIGLNEQAIISNSQNIAQNAQGISNLNRRVTDLDTKVKRTGATAAALAGLRPLDYSPDNPFSASASLGHYEGKEALAVGMFMRPTENFMVGLGASTSGSRDVMMNLGVSYRFGGGSSYSGMTKSDLAQKVVAMSQHNDALDAQLRSANIREEASAKRLNQVSKQLKATQSELKSAQKKAALADQKLDMVMKELAALREEIQKMKQK